MIKEVLNEMIGIITNRAYSPDKRDYRYALASRLKKNERIACLSIGPESVKIASVPDEKSEKQKWEAYVYDRTIDYEARIKSICHTNLVVANLCPSEVSVGIINDEIKVDGINTMLHENPEGVIHQSADPDRRYLVIPIGGGSQGVIFSVAAEEVVAVENEIENKKLVLMRLQCGIYNLLRYAIRFARSNLKAQAGVVRIITAYDQGLIVQMQIASDGEMVGPLVMFERLPECGKDSEVRVADIVDRMMQAGDALRASMAGRKIKRLEYLWIETGTGELIKEVSPQIVEKEIAPEAVGIIDVNAVAAGPACEFIPLVSKEY